MFGKRYRLTKAFGGRGSGIDRPVAVVRHERQEPPPVPVGPPRTHSTAPVEERVNRLDEAVTALTPYLRDSFIYSAVLVNPLLVVWGAAQAVEPEVASPVEHLLTDLLHRTTVASEEIFSAIADVRARALQVLVLEGCLSG